jgi:hypothetical protein
MRSLPLLALRLFVKILILLLAGLVSLSIGAIFHFQSDATTAIVFLVCAFSLFFMIERRFPVLYSRSGRGAHKSR